MLQKLKILYCHVIFILKKNPSTVLFFEYNRRFILFQKPKKNIHITYLFYKKNSIHRFYGSWAIEVISTDFFNLKKKKITEKIIEMHFQISFLNHFDKKCYFATFNPKHAILVLLNIKYTFKTLFLKSKINRKYTAHLIKKNTPCTFDCIFKFPKSKLSAVFFDQIVYLKNKTIIEKKTYKSTAKKFYKPIFLISNFDFIKISDINCIFLKKVKEIPEAKHIFECAFSVNLSKGIKCYLFLVGFFFSSVQNFFISGEIFFFKKKYFVLEKFLLDKNYQITIKENCKFKLTGFFNFFTIQKGRFFYNQFKKIYTYCKKTKYICTYGQKPNYLIEKESICKMQEKIWNYKMSFYLFFVDLYTKKRKARIRCTWNYLTKWIMLFVCCYIKLVKFFKKISLNFHILFFNLTISKTPIFVSFYLSFKKWGNVDVDLSSSGLSDLKYNYTDYFAEFTSKLVKKKYSKYN